MAPLGGRGLSTTRDLEVLRAEGAFPVSYVDRAGFQVGRAAHRNGPTGELITLAYGGSVTADVGFASAGNWDPEVCEPQPVWGIRVYPPDETVPLYVGFVDEVGWAGAVDQLSTTAVYQG